MTPPHPQSEYIITDDELRKITGVLCDEGYSGMAVTYEKIIRLRPVKSEAVDAVLDNNLITEIIGTLTTTEGFVPTAIRSEVMRLREKLAKELRSQTKERAEEGA